jgi:hypothetical protein
MVFIGLGAYAQTSLEINLVGYVEDRFQITIPLQSYLGTVSQQSQTTWNLGELSLNSNARSWNIQISSLSGAGSGGFLVNSDFPNKKLAYQVSLGSLSPQPMSLPWTSGTLGKTPTSGLSIPLEVHILRDEDDDFFQAGTYSDFLVITIVQDG